MTKRLGSSSLRLRPGAWLAAVLLATFAGPCLARGQGTVSVLPVQGLHFGTLASGMPTVISPLDGSHRAAIELLGGGAMTVSFELPSGLVASNGGAPLPLHFGAADGRVVLPGSPRTLVFDPALPVSFQVPPGSPGATLYLGGSAVPGARQAPGSYDAQITVNVTVANPAT
jgi:hypothetical protein